MRPLERRLQLKGAKILVMGAGGAARAAVFGLKDKGAEIFILNRTAEAAQKLARQAKAKTFKREQMAKTNFDVIINATPAGMRGVKPASLLDPNEINARLVFDLVYNPIDTPLIRMAREKGFRWLRVSRCSFTRAPGSSRFGRASRPPKKRCCASWCMRCASRPK